MQENQSKDLQGQMQESLSFVIGLIASFFVSPFIFAFTKSFVIPFAGVITGGLLDKFIASFIWGACVYGGVFFAVTYFMHIKLTVIGTRMITKQFEPEAAPHKNQKDKSGAGEFIKGIFFTILMILIIGLLSGCNEEQNQHNRRMQSDTHVHEQRMAEGRGRFAKREADAKRTQEKTMATMAANAAREAQQAFHSFISNTISPLLLLITGMISFVCLICFLFFRFCKTYEKIVECRTKEAIAMAFMATKMTPEERQKAFNTVLNAPNVLDLKALR